MTVQETLPTSELHLTLQRYLDQRRLLSEVSQRIAASAGLAETLPHVLNGICEATGAVSARAVIGENGGTISFASESGEAKFEAADPAIYSFGQTQQAQVEIVDITVAPSGLDLAGLSGLVSSVLVLPIQAQKTHYGALWIAFKQPHQLTQDERDFVGLLTLQATIAIANARTFEEAKSGREQLAAILASVADAIIMVDKQRKIRVFNPAAEALFQVTAKAALGQPFKSIIKSDTLQKLVYPDEQNDGAETIVEYVASDGRIFAPHVSEVISENGNTDGWLLAVRDVSRFKRLNENMSDFLRTVSHDLRSPLTAAKGYLDMLPMVGEVNDKQEGMMGKIFTSIDDMTNLVEKVLDAGRLDPMMGTYQLRRESIDPTDIVSKVVSTLSNAAQKKQINLRARAASNVPIMYLDEMMIERALQNLVENAIKYTPEGGEVIVETEVKNETLIFSVTDNGLGIAPEDQTRLFERGERVRRKEHKGIRGSGLGLFIVRNVAQQHGGDAAVQSEEGKGSRFEILIPLIDVNLRGGGD
ncbi:MAG: PAS domain S-box protein [Chloroflexi bacterium]|nr:PAS domain S-box protein [Chloroflexota bacterium]